MKEQLISFETALLAKEKGFKIKHRNIASVYWCNDIDSITKTQYKPYFFLNGDYLRGYKKYKENTVKELTKLSDRYVDIQLPTQSLLQKWLREKHNIHINMYRNALGFQCNLDKAECGTHICKVVEDEELTYEQALEAGLKEALKRIP
jgi:hypothetical protein